MIFKSCYCHTSFYRFHKGEKYEYYHEEDTESVFVIYDKYGGMDNSGYRFWMGDKLPNSIWINYFDKYFIDLKKSRLKKLNKLKWK